jgi:hypothetical protein
MKGYRPITDKKQLRPIVDRLTEMIEEATRGHTTYGTLVAVNNKDLCEIAGELSLLLGGE